MTVTMVLQGFYNFEFLYNTPYIVYSSRRQSADLLADNVVFRKHTTVDKRICLEWPGR